MLYHVYVIYVIYVIYVSWWYLRYLSVRLEILAISVHTVLGIILMLDTLQCIGDLWSPISIYHISWSCGSWYMILSGPPTGGLYESKIGHFGPPFGGPRGPFWDPQKGCFWVKWPKSRYRLFWPLAVKTPLGVIPGSTLEGVAADLELESRNGSFGRNECFRPYLVKSAFGVIWTPFGVHFGGPRGRFWGLGTSFLGVQMLIFGDIWSFYTFWSFWRYLRYVIMAILAILGPITD